MRAYVITDTLGVEHEDSTVPIGVVSSRKGAIDAVEEYLNRFEEPVVWKAKEKHVGYAISGEHVVSYKMFFMNQVED